MEPTSFDDSETVLGTPQGYSIEKVEPLSVCRTKQTDGTPVVISCWKVTAEELAEINRTKRVWLGIMGHTMPPARLYGIDPFNLDVTKAER